MSLPPDGTPLPPSSASIVPPSTTSLVPPRRSSRSFGVVLLVAAIAVGAIISHLWVGLLLGTVMAFAGQPFFRWLLGRGMKRGLAAVLTTVAGGAALLAVTVTMIYFVIDELFAMLRTAKLDLGAGSAALPRRVVDWTSHTLGIKDTWVTGKLEQLLGEVATWLGGAASTIVTGVFGTILAVVIALWTMFYVLVNWPSLAARLEHILPLQPMHTRALILELRDVGRTTFVGTIVTALVQGVLAGIGYAVAGVPHAVALAMLTALASFLPLAGTAFVFVPVGVVQIVLGHPLSGVGLLVWSLLVVVGFADYVVRPRLVGSHNATDPLLMLISLLGGIELLGISGLLVGPMVMSLFITVVRIYEKDVARNRDDLEALEEYKRL